VKKLLTIFGLILVTMAAVCSVSAQTVVFHNRTLALEVGSPIDGAALPDAPAPVEIRAFDSSFISPEAEKETASSRPLRDAYEARTGDWATKFPTASEHFQRFVQRDLSPTAMLGTALDAGVAQFHRQWPSYGFGFHGFEKRYGALMADRTASNFFGMFVFPSVLHQDLRYFRLGPAAPVWKRATYSLSRVMLATGNDGRNSFNSSLVLTTLASKSLENIYYPQPQQGFAETMRRSGLALLDRAQTNLSREFLPDIERYCWKHLPARLKRFEKRLPLSRVWEPGAFSETYPSLR
jgi:hypothetical protein